MDNLPIILGVVVVAAVLVYFLFFRKKAEPATRVEGAKPSAKLEAKKKDDQAPPSSRRGAQLAPESLPSQDVIAAE
ncbi:MAG TPA: hypothetical protein VIF62_33685, partial [Labilithrix sp.]